MLTISFAGKTFEEVLQEAEEFLAAFRQPDLASESLAVGSAISAVAVRGDSRPSSSAATNEQVHEFYRRLKSESARAFFNDVARDGRSIPFGKELFDEYGVTDGKSFAGRITTPISKAMKGAGHQFLGWDPVEHAFTMNADDRAAVLSFLDRLHE